MPETPSIAARVSAAYLELSKAAETLNGVSDALGKAVSEIDDGLKKLNLGVAAWVTFCDDPANSDDPYWLTEEIGYAKISGKWGIAIRSATGSVADGSENEAAWLFNDAPRAMRLDAIEKLPELIKTLSEKAAKMTQELQAKLADTQAIAAAINPPLPTRRMSAPPSPHPKMSAQHPTPGKGGSLPGLAPTPEYGGFNNLDALARMGEKK